MAPDVLYNIAFALKEKDTETEMVRKEMETMMVRKEMETEMVRKEKEMEMEMAKKLLELEKRQQRAFLEKKLSHLAQRCVLECFFKEILVAYADKKTPVYAAITDSQHSTVIQNESSKAFPSMTPINKVLKDPRIRAAVWEHFEFDKGVSYPIFKEDLLYGRLSRFVHSADFRRVLVSDSEDESYRSFMSLLAVRFEFEFSDFNELDASSGELAYD